MKDINGKCMDYLDFSIYDPDADEDVDCQIGVIEYTYVKPNPYTWDSDWDYYGYEDIDYTLVDMQGNEIKITPYIDDRYNDKICETIRNHYNKEQEH